MGDPDVQPAPSGDEQAIIVVNPETGASVILPGQDTPGGSPEDPAQLSTDVTFPDPPDNPQEDQTTTVFEGGDSGGGDPSGEEGGGGSEEGGGGEGGGGEGGGGEGGGGG
jgi:hypothetical protein